MRRPMKKKTHGGKRPGAGGVPKDPAAGNRVMWSGRLHPDTVSKLRMQSKPGLSQAEIIDQAVAQWIGPR